MTLYLNNYVREDIAKIQQWFRQAFGFYPSKKQVVLFSIESVRAVVAEVVAKRRQSYKGLGETTVSIPDEFANKLHTYIADTGELFTSPSFLVETLILFRATSLPQVGNKTLDVVEIRKAQKKNEPTQTASIALHIN